MQILIVDSETTGLKSPSGVVEYAWREIHPETLATLEECSGLVDPGIPIEDGAYDIHGITDADLVGMPKLEDVFNFSGPTIVIGHNVQYDMRYFAKYFDNIKGQLCTLSLARHLIKDSPNHKLGTLASFLNLEVGQAHRAAGDVHTTHELLKHLVTMSGKTLLQLVDGARKAKVYNTMPFGMHKGEAIVSLPKSYLEWFISQDIDGDLKYSIEMSLRIK